MSADGFWKPASVAQDDYVNDSNDGSYRGDESSYMLYSATPSYPSFPAHSRSISQSRQQAPAAPHLQQQRMLLPIYKHRNQILYALEEHRIVVIVGETGSGKSTQLPQYFVAGGWAENDFQIAVTQPRRMAAITLAKRVSQEMNCPHVGNEVGYSVRFDSQFNDTVTKIKYITDGMLLREATLSDPLLSQYSVIVVDEAHERTLNSDAIMGLLKKIRRKRKELRIVICSATIDAEAFLQFFTGQKSTEDGSHTPAGINEEGTIISVDGRQHPVDVLYMAQPARDYIEAAVETAWKIHSREKLRSITGKGRSDGVVGNIGGDIICFLPSAEEIDRAIRLAEEEVFHDDKNVDLLPLYGTLPYHLQMRIFQTKGQKELNRRRVIFCTNIAETSVTVPNISHVIDSGLVKLPYFDPKTGLERLIISPTSQASARQRAGRGGRIQAGTCYRLFTEKFFIDEMKPQIPPEILRTNITSFVLTLKALGVDNILAFDMMDVPSVDSLSHALESLYALGAIDDRTELTDLGLDMSSFPTEPRVSRMLLESLSEGCAWEVLAVASALQVRDLFRRPRNTHGQQQMIDYEAAMADISDPSGDHVTFANLLAEMDDRDMDEEECRERFINFVALKRAMEIRRQLSGCLRQFGQVKAMGLTGDDGQIRSRAIRRCVTAGFFFNVAKLDNDGCYYTLRKHILVAPAPTSILATSQTSPSEYIIFGETLDGARGGIELRAVSKIDARWLRQLAPHYWQ